MAIHQQTTADKKVGFDKEIEASALPMVLDMMQKGQYSYPIPSTIRELASNGWDAIQEKRAALKILAGQARPEDYFIHRDEELYRDSNWDAGYYDPFWLDRNNNEVLIQYIEGEVYDTVKFTDYGVGIGGRRLLGHFKPGWSSKRNSNLSIGMFGLGNKSPLSTGIQYYIEELWYNGRYMKFQVYEHTVNPILPRWNMETKLENHKLLLGKEVAYYQDTKEKNHTVISFTCKKHKKPEFIRAVNSQLLYFKGIRFEVVDREGHLEVKNPQANILYEDQNLIISDNNQFTKPHLVVNNVCYSYIDWLELELEDRTGNVGVKVNMEEITLNPSREQIVWDDKTRAAVMQRVTDSVDSATRLLEKELEGTSLWTWIVKSAEMTVRQDDSVLGRLAKFSSTSNFSPRIELEGYQWRVNELWAVVRMTCKVIEVCELKHQSKNIKLISEPARPADLESLAVFVTREESRTYRARKFLCQEHGQVAVINREVRDRLFLENSMRDSRFMWPVAIWNKAVDRGKENVDRQYLADIAERIAGHVIDSLLVHVKYSDYDSVEVPADFKLTEGEEDEHTEPVKLEPKNPVRLKADAVMEVVMSSGTATRWELDAPKMGNLDAPEVFVGTKNAEDIAGGRFIARIAGGREEGLYLGPKLEITDKYGDSDMTHKINKEEYERLHRRLKIYTGSYVGWGRNIGMMGNFTGAMVIRVSQEHYKKLAARYYTYQEFFVRIDQKLNKITMSNILKNWYTARLIEPAVNRFRFLYFMEAFFLEQHEAYDKLWRHWIKYRVPDNQVKDVDESMFTDMMEFVGKVATLQKAVAAVAGAGVSDEGNRSVDALSRQLFDREYALAEAYDEELVKAAEGLEELEPVRGLFSLLNICHPSADINDLSRQRAIPVTHEQELVIRDYIALKLNSSQNNKEI